MHFKPFRSSVRVVTLGEGRRLYQASPEDAEELCRKGLARPVAGEFTAFVGEIELTVSLGVLRQEYEARASATTKGRPRPRLRAPNSESGGDSGRGLPGHRYRTLHLRQSAFHGESRTATMSR